MITIPKDKIMTITNASEEMIKSYTNLIKRISRANDVPTQKKIMMTDIMRHTKRMKKSMKYLQNTMMKMMNQPYKSFF